MSAEFLDLSDVPAELRPAAEAALRAAGVEAGHLSVELVGERRIRELNRDHRRLDEPTDVLSFPIDGREELPTGPPRQLGDVVLCPAVVGDDWRRPLAHGLLHLLGYDHQTDDEEREMNARADALIAVGRGRGAVRAG